MQLINIKEILLFIIILWSVMYTINADLTFLTLIQYAYVKFHIDCLPHLQSTIQVNNAYAFNWKIISSWRTIRPVYWHFIEIKSKNSSLLMGKASLCAISLFLPATFLTILNKTTSCISLKPQKQLSCSLKFFLHVVQNGGCCMEKNPT